MLRKIIARTATMINMSVIHPAATVTHGTRNGTVSVFVIIALDTTRDCIANAMTTMV